MRFFKMFFQSFLLLTSVYATRFEFDFTGSDDIAGLTPDGKKQFTTVFCFDSEDYFDNCNVKFGGNTIAPIARKNEDGSGDQQSFVLEDWLELEDMNEIPVFFADVESTASASTASASTTTAPAQGSTDVIIGSFVSSKK